MSSSVTPTLPTFMPSLIFSKPPDTPDTAPVVGLKLFKIGLTWISQYDSAIRPMFRQCGIRWNCVPFFLER
jgi:hypothetical protein